MYERMDDFYTYDPQSAGSKGLVFIGDEVLVYRRDEKTEKFPLHLDLPGGGPEAGETPFETFRREVMEEFGLRIVMEDIIYVRRYPSRLEPGKSGYYPVAKLPRAAADKIVFGDEGVEYMLMTLEDYIARDDAWPVFQERAADYKEASTSQENGFMI